MRRLEVVEPVRIRIAFVQPKNLSVSIGLRPKHPEDINDVGFLALDRGDVAHHDSPSQLELNRQASELTPREVLLAPSQPLTQPRYSPRAESKARAARARW